MKAAFDYPTNIHFKCTRCGKCCGDTKKKNRHILLLKSDIDRISKETLLDYNKFSEESLGYEPYINKMIKTKSGKCFFLKNNLCTIYKIRPLICRFYPFPLRDLGNNRHSFSYTKKCPGIGTGSEITKIYFENLYKKMLDSMKEKIQDLI